MAASLQFLGTDGVFSRTVLQALLGAGCKVVRVWLAGGGGGSTVEDAPATGRLPPIPVASFHTLSGIAAAWGVPLQGIADAEALRFPQRLCLDPVDVILAACFPFRLPRWLLAFPTYGCLNLHPSLLPAYRGPTPIFWQLRAGLSEGGVTLHVMAEELDAGDIVARERLRFAAGITASQLNQQLAEIGARLAVRALTDLEEGGTLSRRPQDERNASYFSWPKERDFHLCTEWPAERAFRFIRGTGAWGRSYPLICGGRRFSIVSATAFSEESALEKPWEWRGAELWIRFRPGTLRAMVGQAQCPWSESTKCHL